MHGKKISATRTTSSSADTRKNQTRRKCAGLIDDISPAAASSSWATADTHADPLERERRISKTAIAGGLSAKQQRFASLVARLIVHAQELGYGVTLGEAWRSLEVASFKTKFNAAKGTGIVNSLHRIRLAIDLNLFRDEKFLTDTRDYQPLGEWWEKQCPDCRWGGRFKRADGNHFSLQHQGVE